MMNELIYYIIDREKGFTGRVLGTIGKDGYVHTEERDKRIDLFEFRKITNNPHLVYVTEEELLFEVKKFYQYCENRFIPINSEDYYFFYRNGESIRKYDCLCGFFFTYPRGRLNKTLHCLRYEGRYFIGDISTNLSFYKVLQLADETIQEISKGTNSEDLRFTHLLSYSYDELKKVYHEYVAAEMRAGGLLESDWKLNSMNIMLAEKMREKHGKAFLGKYECDKKQSKGYSFTEYTGQIIYYPGWDIIVPPNHHELLAYIQKNGMNNSDEISKRVDELDGEILIWS